MLTYFDCIWLTLIVTPNNHDNLKTDTVQTVGRGEQAYSV